jgi:hypothetical protein
MFPTSATSLSKQQLTTIEPQQSLTHSPTNSSFINSSKSKSCYDRRLVGQFVLEYSPHLGLKTRFSLLSDDCGFVDIIPHELVLLIRSQHRPRRKYRFVCCSAIITFVYVGVPTGSLLSYCLVIAFICSHYLATAVV